MNKCTIKSWAALTLAIILLFSGCQGGSGSDEHYANDKEILDRYGTWVVHNKKSGQDHSLVLYDTAATGTVRTPVAEESYTTVLNYVTISRNEVSITIMPRKDTASYSDIGNTYTDYTLTITVPDGSLHTITGSFQQLETLGYLSLTSQDNDSYNQVLNALQCGDGQYRVTFTGDTDTVYQLDFTSSRWSEAYNKFTELYQ
jgi:hypothetical protein